MHYSRRCHATIRLKLVDGVRWQGGDTEYPLAGLRIKLVLGATHFRWASGGRREKKFYYFQSRDGIWRCGALSRLMSRLSRILEGWEWGAWQTPSSGQTPNCVKLLRWQLFYCVPALVLAPSPHLGMISPEITILRCFPRVYFVLLCCRVRFELLTQDISPYPKTYRLLWHE